MAIHDTYTRVNLREKIAKILGIFPEGGSLSSMDADNIDEQVDLVFREALEQGLVNFDVTDDNIEQDVFRSYANIIAFSLLDEFGVPEERAQRITQSAQRSEAVLIKRAKSPYKRSPVRPDYF